MPSAALTGVPS